MKFWKEHPALRVALIAGCFVVGLVLIFVGWSMPGQLSGLAIMAVGLVSLLASLAIYNKIYQDPKAPKAAKGKK